MRWIHLRLVGPMASFGGELVDAQGVIRDFPALSMMTGLLANALGWTRTMADEHQELQDRLVFGGLWEDDGSLRRMTDYQTASLRKDDRAWTTRGSVASRDGGPKTYDGSHQRFRDYHVDLRMSVVARLNPEANEPTLDQLAEAVDQPARPLFIGRKCCLPATPVFSGFVEARDVRTALAKCTPKDGPRDMGYRAFWPWSEQDQGLPVTDGVRDVTDERNWHTGLHGGSRRICEGRISTHGDDE